MGMWRDSLRRIPDSFLSRSEGLNHAEVATHFMNASGGDLYEGYVHDGPGVCLCDGQTEAYLKDMDMTGLAPAWVTARRRPIWRICSDLYSHHRLAGAWVHGSAVGAHSKYSVRSRWRWHQIITNEVVKNSLVVVKRETIFSPKSSIIRNTQVVRDISKARHCEICTYYSMSLEFCTHLNIYSLFIYIAMFHSEFTNFVVSIIEQFLSIHSV